jgi:plasmid stabilization system protein ParE
MSGSSECDVEANGLLPSGACSTSLGDVDLVVVWYRREEIVGQESPAHWIERHRVELRVLDEDGFLAAVRAIPALADSDSPSWEQEEPWDDAYRLLAAADVIGERGWVKAIVPVFERAARGDLYETMQWLRHGPERAARADQLAALLEPLTTHPRAGTRQWAVRELGILRQRSSLQPLIHALADDDDEVRTEARGSLEMLAQVHPEVVGFVSGLPGTR